MSKRIPISLGFILLLLAIWVLVTPNRVIHAFTDRLNHLGYDLQLRSRIYSLKMKPSGNVVIVDIDDKSLKAEGRWPWPRSKMAQLVNKLQENHVAVIAFDIFFPEAEVGVDERLEEILQKNNVIIPVSAELKPYASLFDEDEILAKSLKNVSAVLSFGFLLSKVEQNNLPPPLLKLKPDEMNLRIINANGYTNNIPMIEDAASATGFINVFADDDGIVRQVPLVMKYKENVYGALALQAYLTYLGETVELQAPDYSGEKYLEGLVVGRHLIPTDSRGAALIPFIGRSYTFPYYSAIDVLENKIPTDALTGKIVFVGTSATGLGDLQPTAAQNPFPGVEIQASLADGMIRHDFSYMPRWTLGATVFLTILFGLFGVFVFPRLLPRTLILIFLFFPIIVFYANNIIWSQTGLIISVLIPVILVLLLAILNITYGYLFETRRREELKTMFGQYVPADHIDEMLKSKNNFALRGENREMSVLFSDICGFTTLAEKMNATELVDMLNLYLTPMTEIIYKYVGTVDKYVGDMIIAFWGAPLPDTDHAYHAICSALEMQAELKNLRESNAMRKWPEIHVGIGINSGHMSVGDMGSRYRRNYTVMGDSVNLASRAEGLTRFYQVEIIVTQFTQELQPNFVYRQLDLVKVKGKKEAVAIYEVIGKEGSVDKDIKRALVNYHKALDLYLHKNWSDSLAIFMQLHEADPKKKIYSIYIDRIKYFAEHPPAADWNGVYEHKEK